MLILFGYTVIEVMESARFEAARCRGRVGYVRSAGRRKREGAAQILHRNLFDGLDFKGLQLRCFVLIALQNYIYVIEFIGKVSGLKIPRS
jgi:hypothetical protein